MSQSLQLPAIDNSVVALRATLYADTCTLSEYAKARGVSIRTVQREIACGKLEIVHDGRTPRVVVSKARERLMSSAKARHEPIRRGRPAKSKA